MTEPRTEPAWAPGPAWLFCPADRPERYPKALAAADIVIIDLEDAVAPGNRTAARTALRSLAADGSLDNTRTIVRVNAAGTPDHALDLATLQDCGITRIMLAKTESAAHVASLPFHVIALFETPLGVERAGEIAFADNVIAVMWGAEDLTAGLGGMSSRHADGRYRDVSRYARSRALIAAKAAGRLAIDTVHLDIPDIAGLADECADAVASGFDATAAIHPTQVQVIRAAYAPSAEQVDWARRLFDHIGTERGVTTFEGAMVDGPVYAAAQRILARASTANPEAL